MPQATIPDAGEVINNPGGVSIEAAPITGDPLAAGQRPGVAGDPGASVGVPLGRPHRRAGLPAVLGWLAPCQQRGTYGPQVDQRLRDVQTMFNDPSPGRVIPLLSKYQVRYIYVGDLERAYYTPAGIAKFDQMTDTLRPIYHESGVTIYEVISRA
jgi:uncharacterized membrane protein